MRNSEQPRSTKHALKLPPTPLLLLLLLLHRYTAALRRRRRRQRKRKILFALGASTGRNFCSLLPPQLPSHRLSAHQFRPRIRAGIPRVEASTEAARLWRMGSSASCLWGGSKSTTDRTGQTMPASPRSGHLLSRSGRNVQVFSLKELKTATRNFHMLNCIGRGGFGPVYKGDLKDGRQVAIKRLAAESRQGADEFLTEIDVISNVRHPNLVRLIGCCVEGNNRLLVYEYAENNSLSNALLGPKSRCIPLNWQRREAICTGTASGLAFLHEEAQPRIVHRDIKASNILLDKKLLPKIGDFGLAKLFPDAVTHISTRVAGTMGYLAPEYALLGQLTKKADIYSFGVLLLEVISGESSSKSTWGEDLHVLVEWTWKLREEGRLLEIVDPDLEEYPEDQVLHFIKVALLCTQATAQQRPSMKQVAHMLSNQTEIDLQNAVPPGVLKEPRRKMGSLTLDTSSSQMTRRNVAGSCSTQTRDMNSYQFSTTEISPR